MTISTELGQLILDEVTQFYVGQHWSPHFFSNDFSIVENELESGVLRLKEFFGWFARNHDQLKLRVEYKIGDNDLIWDDVWDSILGEGWPERWDEPPGILADLLKFAEINYYDGHIHLWVNSSGLHTDHLVHVRMKKNEFDVDYCEL
ncbi:MAG: hypothetical protein AAF585_07085 [Verrucomicrobiota bacterium]